LFLGDSITDMARGRNERDRNHYLRHGEKREPPPGKPEHPSLENLE
jgi:hypothetical protein